MAKQDYYATLGVARDAGAEDLKKAYRKLAMQLHPDRNPGDKQAEARFKELNEAYDVLKDDQKRAAYDRFGHAAFEQGGPGAGAHGFDFGGAGGLGDIFDQMFGEFMGGAARPRPRPAAGQRYPRQRRDRTRRGVRRHQGAVARAHPGRLRGLQPAPARRARTAAARPARPAAAPARCARSRASSWSSAPARPAAATGRVIRNPCRICRGTGTVQRERSLSVQVAGRRRGRHAHPPGRRGRGGRPGRAARRPLRARRRSGRTRSSSATAPTSSAGCRCA